MDEVGEMRIRLAAIACMMVTGCSLDRGDEVDRLFAAYDGGMPGAAVMVIRGGEPILTKTYGLAHVGDGRPVTATTNFRLASVTKQFTATAVLMLVDEGRLALDDPVRRHFPQFPPFMDAVTIRHLLNHTSGILDYEPIYGDPFPEQVSDAGVVDIIAGTDRTYFEPGSEYRYSNSAYAVLSSLVTKLSGQPFAEFLEDRIFAPLGMDRTLAFVADGPPVPERAFGYTVENGRVEFTDQSAWSAVLGDGGVYTSLTDLAKWDRALYDNDLLPAGLWQAAWTPGLEHYGFGWRIDEYRGHRRLHHSGSTSGFRNFMQRFPDLGLTIIVLTNRAEPDVEPLAEQVGDLFLN